MAFYKIKFLDDKYIPFIEKQGPIENVIIKHTQLKDVTAGLNIFSQRAVSLLKFEVNSKPVAMGETYEFELTIYPRRSANIDKIKVVSLDEDVATVVYDADTNIVTVTPVSFGRADIHAFVDEPDVVTDRYNTYGTMFAEPSNTLTVDVFDPSKLGDVLAMSVKEDTGLFKDEKGVYHVMSDAKIPVNNLLDLVDFGTGEVNDKLNAKDVLSTRVSGTNRVKTHNINDELYVSFLYNGEFHVSFHSIAFPDVKLTMKFHSHDTLNSYRKSTGEQSEDESSDSDPSGE